jgi:uncharacterized protein YozE (UPF0346 family)
MFFRVWIRQFIEDNNAIGDLSRDINEDSNFPKKNDYNTLLVYLKDRDACDNAIQTLKESWYQYTLYNTT